MLQAQHELCVSREAWHQKRINNSRKAFKAIGWQGGNIHQVARETGLTVEQILSADDVESLIKEALNG